MSRGPSTSQFSADFDGFRAGRFFYNNLRIQEILTTIRYGIEARKGLVVITGASGVGKTTLLYKVATELSSNVNCIVESDPRVSFTEVLQLLLRSLGAENVFADEQAMVHSCQRELRTRLQKAQLVALMFDNAHHLSEQTLRQVIKHFCGGSAEDPEGTLLQLVLAGRPELKVRMSEAALLPLRRRTPIWCEVHALSSQEIGPYIQHGLLSADQAAELFDARAIKRIALYTKGNPRAVNALCEHAARAAAEAGETAVTAELIDDIARELNLIHTEAAYETAHGPVNLAEEPITAPQFDFKLPPWTSHENYTMRPAAEEDYTQIIGRTFADFDAGDDGRTRLRRGKKKLWVAALLFLIMLAGADAWVDTEAARDSLTYWSNRVHGTIARMQEADRATDVSTALLRSGSDAEPDKTAAAPSATVTLPHMPEPLNHSPETLSEPLIESLPAKNGKNNNLPGDAKSEPARPSLSKPEPRPSLEANFKPRSREDLQLEVAKAIQSRAIMGVEVSVSRGIVYLHGRVATERQRRAAERAARSVSDSVQVHNRLVVD